MSDGSTYPGVYFEEVPSGVRTIAGVATSITAFIGRAKRGPSDEPKWVRSFSDYQRIFGGLWFDSPMSYAVHQFFLNGGRDALIVRVTNGGVKATLDLPAASGSLRLRARGEGTWGNSLGAIVDHDTRDPSDSSLFNLTIQEFDPQSGEVARVETFRSSSINDESSRSVEKILEEESELVTVDGALPSDRPNENREDAITRSPIPTDSNGDGDDGDAVDGSQISHPGLEVQQKGIWALEKADLFNLLCIPPFCRELDVDVTTLDTAAAYCVKRRAMLLVDPPLAWASKDDAVTGIQSLAMGARMNAAIFFPRLKMGDSRQENRSEEFAPCSAVAGVFARTDAERGVWKAPAGQEATLIGVRELSVKLTDDNNAQLNLLGVNCLRTFPLIGSVVWGARTLDCTDRPASEWKYIPVRRTALFIEESLDRGLKWVVFEPNGERLWDQIRLHVGAFMHNLFRQGALQGQTPRDAYFVRCDKETTTRNDIDRGIVNIWVGFAPLKPAEFVIIQLQQMAGQIQG